MASTQRLAALQTNLDPEVAAAIAVGWDRSEDAAVRLLLADRLLQRSDADDDLVAAAIYSLRASIGSAEDAKWAVARFVEAALDRATYADSATEFRTLDDDASLPAVVAELEWLSSVVDAAEASDDLAELSRQLRHR